MPNNFINAAGSTIVADAPLPPDNKSSEAPIRVVVVEDETLLRNLLVNALVTDNTIEVIADFADAQSALHAIPNDPPDVVVLDIALGRGMTGVQLGVELRNQLPRIGVMLLSNHYEPHLLSAVRDRSSLGWSYMLKGSVSNIEMIVRAIHGTAAGLVVIDPAINKMRVERGPVGQHGLTRRQVDVLSLIAEGFSNAGIASRLFLSEKSVENHVSRIFQQLGISADQERHSRVNAALRYLDIVVTESVLR
jgi:DNA-binding NarL/FixJ family response regulator